MATFTLDWNSIRPLNGSRAEGFEELCAQLARAECPPGSCFERKGTPDAGVECYAILADGTEWGWQAKYFDVLNDSQWSQLDDSVRTALEKHPRLVRYFLCIPLDRSDARVQGRRSAKERWQEHVAKWAGWASGRGVTVEFVYWGSYELLERLSRPQHVGRVRFWFDVRGFDRAWFAAHLDEALRTAGPRYTPQVHVDLPIAGELEAFGRTERFFDRIKAHARGIRKNRDAFRYSESKKAGDLIPGESVSSLLSKIQVILYELSAITVQPVGVLPFQRIAEHVSAAEGAVKELKRVLSEREREYDNRPPEGGAGANRSAPSNNPFREQRYRLIELSDELRSAGEALVHAETIAGRALMLLKGTAGTGKTHLLCDVARQRIAAGRPTVLLMGQQFVSTDAPWRQALQQLDLPGLSADEFVGALEAAAQAADCRAIVMIDAMNEGSGRVIWPNHLSAFLARLERSPWIGVILSVRSSYEQIVIPEEVGARAASVTHHGFAEHEYDATRTFFVYYGLEMPSTPLLTPEFRNPLFLKTLCRGLNEKGERRLPRGFHGITAVFDLYLSAINDRLASALGFNPKDLLVSRALGVLAKALVEAGERWLSRAQAEGIVNSLLPGREFERSLYRGLVVEGILVEEAAWRQNASRDEVVFIAYDRFADHLISKILLEMHLNPDAPASAFVPGAPLAFLFDKSQYVSPGLLEAMCIQVPERTGKELISVAPSVVAHWGIGDAFRQSLVWRDPAAFSQETREALNKLLRSDHDWDDTLDVLLTVAMLPEHPLNATFLNDRLRAYRMPDRDAWWSTYLHRAWRTHGAVDRLIDWASSLDRSLTLDDEAVDLCATALAWMFTASNRPLRDRATTALVNLLTDRLGAAVRLIELFADVDDPYVLERVYATAYGTAMRSCDVDRVGHLATCVYGHVFAAGSPPAHILLRDYARGVVERAIYLGAPIDVVVEKIRPPYASRWPVIPTEDDITPLLPDWSRGSHDSRDLEWSRNRIGSSVMSDDFARYVIGTNSLSTSWLSVRLDEPAWRSPDERVAALLSEFSDAERSAWEKSEAATSAVRRLSMARWLVEIRNETVDENSLTVESSETAKSAEHDRDLARAEQDRTSAFAALESALTKDHLDAAQTLLTLREGDGRHPPRFDVRLIQRYVLWRVFDLGWTTERFGYFDRFVIGYSGREASKSERIGKKYQWIAYHEILAFVADHFRYRERFREDGGDQAYEGPWQDYLRDIDPSCTLRATPGGTSWDGHSPAWWGLSRYENWGDGVSPELWVKRYDDLPVVEDLLRVSCSQNGSRWLNVQGYFNWKQRIPADRESSDVERRELWYICTGYLVRTQDADAFLKWAEEVDFWGRWMPDAPEVYRMFLGEYGWSPASRHFQQQYFGDAGWTQPDHGCPAKVRTAAFEYVREAKSFDCAIDESYTLRLPCNDLFRGLGLRWTGNGADYINVAGGLVAFDPTAYADGPSALLLREDSLREFLARSELAICWTVLGEKRVLGAGLIPHHHAALRLTGAYVLGAQGPTGFLKCVLDESGGDNPAMVPLVTLRTG